MAGVLSYALSLNSRGFTGPLSSAQSQLRSFVSQAGSSGRGLSGLSGLASRAGTAFGGMGAAVAGAAAPVLAFAAALALAKAQLEAVAEQDSLTRALRTIEGTAGATKERLEELREVAKMPGLGFEEAIRGDVRLRSAGISAELSARSLKAFGNALSSAGAGKAELQGVNLALSQIAAKGKVSAEEINQIAERLPQIRTAMKGAFGTADTEALDKMGIDATQFIEGIVEQLEKLPKATSGAQNTLDNYSDAWKAFKTETLDVFTPLSTSITEFSTKALEDARKGVSALRRELGLLPSALSGSDDISSKLAKLREEKDAVNADREYLKSRGKAAPDEKLTKAQVAERLAALASEDDLAARNADFHYRMEEQKTEATKRGVEKRTQEEERAREKIAGLAARAIEVRTLDPRAVIQQKIKSAQAEGPSGQAAFEAEKDVRVQAVIAERTVRLLELKRELLDLDKTSADLASKRAAAEQKAAAQTNAAVSLARGEWESQTAILAARASGNTKLADELERQRKIEQLKLDLMERQGLAEEDALAAARQRLALEEKIAGGKKRGLKDAVESALARLDRNPDAKMNNSDRLGLIREGQKRGLDRAGLEKLSPRELAEKVNEAGKDGGADVGRNFINPKRALEAADRAARAADPRQGRGAAAADPQQKALDAMLGVVTEIKTTFATLATA